MAKVWSRRAVKVAATVAGSVGMAAYWWVALVLPVARRQAVTNAREGEEPCVGSSEFKGTAADARVRLILDDLYSQLEEAFYAIGRIAEAEVERLGEDTPEGDAWKSFAAGGALTPAGSGLTTAMKEIAAIRGELVYRELDSNQVGYVPLNQREQSQPNDEDDEDLE